jgi:hypothetical protein
MGHDLHGMAFGFEVPRGDNGVFRIRKWAWASPSHDGASFERSYDDIHFLSFYSMMLNSD